VNYSEVVAEYRALKRELSQLQANTDESDGEGLIVSAYFPETSRIEDTSLVKREVEPDREIDCVLEISSAIADYKDCDLLIVPPPAISVDEVCSRRLVEVSLWDRIRGRFPLSIQARRRRWSCQ